MIERNIKLKQIKNIYKHSTPTPTRSNNGARPISKRTPILHHQRFQF